MAEDGGDDLTDIDPTGKIIPLKRRGSLKWTDDLINGKNGPLAIVANAMIILGHDSELAKLLFYDEFAHRIMVTRPPPAYIIGGTLLRGPYPRQIGDDDVTLIQAYIQRAYRISVGQSVAQQAITTMAQIECVHPVRDWVDGLQWDLEPRVETWLCSAFGVPDNAYYRAIGTKLLAAAVARVRHPGCKFDYVTVLEGAQGRGKSRACAALFGRQWFTDNLPHDLTSKDAQQGVGGKWGIELAELNALFRSSHQVAKAFFSRQNDYFRPPFGKSFVEQPRQCVFIGTTNDVDYLTDATGNRRYWPVSCGTIDVQWIEANRDQLWAEAAVIEEMGEDLWLEEPITQARALVQQSRRVAEDVWTVAIRIYITATIPHRQQVRIAELMHHALNLTSAQQTRAGEMRCAGILRADGWLRKRITDENKRQVVVWLAPGSPIPGLTGYFVPDAQMDDDKD